MVKSIIGEIILDLRLNNIEKFFHLPRVDQYVRLTYHQEERWYTDNEKKDIEIIQSLYFINRTPTGQRAGKVDMTRGYMKDDIV